jgi:excisionase family DNA binding protein
MPVPICRTVQEAYDAGRADALGSAGGTAELAAKVAELLAPLLSHMAVPPPLLSIAQAAEVLGVTRRYMYDLVYAGEVATVRLPSSKSGKDGAHRIERAELDGFIEKHRQRHGF